MPVGAVPVEHELGVVHRAEIVVSVAAFQYGYLQRVLLPVPYCFLQSAQDFLSPAGFRGRSDVPDVFLGIEIEISVLLGKGRLCKEQPRQ